ncbi:MAG: PadR family transcriptional regulator [Longimicrobiales bacterium]
MPSDTSKFLPLKAVPHLILLLLEERPDYGVELLERLERTSRGTVQLNPGSLYRTIARLVEDGLIRPLGTEQAREGTGAPRKLYGVTAFGRRVLEAEAARQAELVALASRLHLLKQQP